jgi:O-antigen/teichoic acid export membrane protein
MPAASGVHASLGIEKLKEVFQTTFKYIALIVTPAFLFISIFADRIILIWLGPGYEETAFVLRFLSIAYMLNIFTGPGASILTGMGLPHIPLFCSIIAAVTNVTLNLILIGKFGIAGIIISVISTYTTNTLYFYYFFPKKTGVSILNIFLRGLKFPLLTSISILLIFRLIDLYLLRDPHIGLVSTTILFPIIYILLVYINPEYRTIRDFIRRHFSLLRWLI